MVLPVSGIEVFFRVPDGSDDLATLEAAGGMVEQALAVLSRLTLVPSGKKENDLRPWQKMTVTDFEAALLGLRKYLFGDSMGCIFRSASHNAGETMELEVSIDAFLEGVKAEMPQQVQRCESQSGQSALPDWYELGDVRTPVRFRLPAVEDQVKVHGRRDASRLMAERCIETPALTARVQVKVERAMEAMAPAVSRPVTGSCPECGEPISMTLYVPKVVVDELKMSAVGVHEEIDAIAGAYHWDEATILAMPQSRRQAYASTIRRLRREAV